MKGKIIVKDEKWYVEIQSDLHGYGIGWGDSKVYPLLIINENIWAGKEVEVEPVHYDSNFIPVIVKIKEVVETTVVNTMPKNEEGKPFVNTMPMIETNKPMKTAMQELIEHFEDFKKHSPNVKLTLDEIINLLKDNLEKEKEQNKETWFRSTAQFDNAAEMTYKKLFDEYYQETYNQNK